MRRLYESRAVERDDDHHFTPNNRDRDVQPRAFRSIPGNWLSRRLVPNWVRYRAITVDITADRTAYAAAEAIPFRVTLQNVLPIPIDIPTRSPVLWYWTIDGHREASRITHQDAADQPRAFHFDRGERKEFQKHWNGRFRVSTSEWETADPGAYTLGVALNVDEPWSRGLAAETTVRIGEQATAEPSDGGGRS